jgi:hypothetical protein
MKQNHFRNFILVAAIACLSLVFASCGSSVTGTYSDASGSFMLELRSGGKAAFTFMGETASCTYAVDGTKLNLNCEGDAGKTVFTIHDDGSLTGPPGTLFPPLRKRK